MTKKIAYCSDIHLEWTKLSEGLQNEEGADLLILAGDICVAIEAEKYLRFFEETCGNFHQVLYIPGNHEHYMGHIDDTVKNLRNKLGHINNLCIANNHEYDYYGIKIWMGTLWSDMSRNDPLIMEQCRMTINDYNYISCGEGYTRNLSPSDTVKLFEETVDLINYNADIVVTHHAPSYQATHPRFRYSTTSGAFYSNLDKKIYDSNIKYWIYGHVHYNTEFEIGGTKVMSNCYLNDMQSKFQMKYFEI